MGRKLDGNLPAPLDEMAYRFKSWRSHRERRGRIPTGMWEGAVALARDLGRPDIGVPGKLAHLVHRGAVSDRVVDGGLPERMDARCRDHRAGRGQCPRPGSIS